MLNLFAEFIQNPSNKANDNTKEKFATTSVVNPLQCANLKTRCNANDASASKPAAIDAIFGVLNCPTPGFVLSTPGLITKRNLDMNDVSSAHDCHIMKKLKPLPHPKKMAGKSLLFDLDPCGNDVDTAVHVNKCLKEGQSHAQVNAMQ